ncbi:unnamed protein product [Pleuronectes platessa]|uniref:Uncharacterized protein n=1 Tax=Pleuronectes platessa TaxID=8262 RepID=A0A9N7U168_PLEPL|nr:unnamed protein product [Pleuronectes platessa]
MECTTLSREGAGLAKPPKHLWRQPRTHIRIKQRFNSDNERYLCRNRTLEKLRPGLKKPRMSWPFSLKRNMFVCLQTLQTELGVFEEGSSCVAESPRSSWCRSAPDSQ